MAAAKRDAGGAPFSCVAGSPPPTPSSHGWCPALRSAVKMELATATGARQATRVEPLRADVDRHPGGVEAEPRGAHEHRHGLRGCAPGTPLAPGDPHQDGAPGRHLGDRAAVHRAVDHEPADPQPRGLGHALGCDGVLGARQPTVHDRALGGSGGEAGAQLGRRLHREAAPGRDQAGEQCGVRVPLDRVVHGRPGDRAGEPPEPGDCAGDIQLEARGLGAAAQRANGSGGGGHQRHVFTFLPVRSRRIRDFTGVYPSGGD